MARQIIGQVVIALAIVWALGVVAVWAQTPVPPVSCEDRLVEVRAELLETRKAKAQGDFGAATWEQIATVRGKELDAAKAELAALKKPPDKAPAASKP
jgi:hypothetical protein